MCEVLLFGGTSEGRRLAEYMSSLRLSSLICVATEYGETVMDVQDPVRVRVGRLDADQIADLIRAERPRFVVDATHPYADVVTRNIREACDRCSVACLRVHRDSEREDGCRRFATLAEAIAWINTVPGVVFSSLGAKASAEMCAISDFAQRVWLRILPYPSGIESCLRLGYPMGHIIAMQGPFTEEFNVACFRQTGASVLLTKDTGKQGGFHEKVAAARTCGMQIAVIERPEDAEGYSMEQIMQKLKEVSL